MLQTIEAIYEPTKGVVFKEPIPVTQSTKVLVTFIESYQSSSIEKGSSRALLNVLKKHALPKSAQSTDEEIELHIQEVAQSWES